MCLPQRIFETFTLPPLSSDNSNLEVVYRRIKLQEICFEVIPRGRSEYIGFTSDSATQFESLYFQILIGHMPHSPTKDCRGAMTLSTPPIHLFLDLVSSALAFGLSRPSSRDSPAPCRRRVTYLAKQCDIVLLSGVQISY